MTQLKKRATALLLGFVTFFIALAMPYNTTRVYAADVAFSWVVNESSNTILNWILLYLGISVAPEAISEGKVFDKTGQFAMDFCQEFFGDTFEQWYVSNGFTEDIDSFKHEFNNILTQDFDAAKYVAGDVKSSVLDIIYNYLHATNVLGSGVYSSDLSDVSGKMVGDVINGSGSVKYETRYGLSGDTLFMDYTIVTADSPVYFIGAAGLKESNYGFYGLYILSLKPFSVRGNVSGKIFDSSYDSHGFYYRSVLPTNVSVSMKSFTVSWTMLHVFLGVSSFKNFDYNIANFFSKFLSGTAVIPNIDIPDVAGKDYAFDLVGYPWAWDIDKPNVKPWDGVDSLPIPGDIAIGDSFPGVVDIPGIETGVIDGTIPWPDVIGAVRDIDIPAPEPDPDEPDKKPEPDPELPEIPAVLPQGVSDKLKDLSGKFPFCIPFDLVDCFKSFGSNEAAEAPKWDMTFRIPGTNKDYEFSVDLSMFDKYIPIFRSGVLILFLIGLIIGTRKLIGWQVKN